MNATSSQLATAVQSIQAGIAAGNITGIDAATLDALTKAMQAQSAPQHRYFTVYLPGHDSTKPETSELRLVVGATDEATIRKHLPFACTVREVSLAGLQPADRERVERMARTNLTELRVDAYARIARHAPRDGASATIDVLADHLETFMQLASQGQPASSEQVDAAAMAIINARRSNQYYLVARAGLRYIVTAARKHEGGPTPEYFDALADRLMLFPEQQGQS